MTRKYKKKLQKKKHKKNNEKGGGDQNPEKSTLKTTTKRNLKPPDFKTNIRVTQNNEIGCKSSGKTEIKKTKNRQRSERASLHHIWQSYRKLILSEDEDLTPQCELCPSFAIMHTDTGKGRADVRNTLPLNLLWKSKIRVLPKNDMKNVNLPVEAKK